MFIQLYQSKLVNATINATWLGALLGPRLRNCNLTFYSLINWSKIWWLFLKFTWGNFAKSFFLVISINYCWSQHFFYKFNYCEIENLKYFAAMVKFFYLFLYCQIVISFLELFSPTCLLCILQNHLTRRNT